MKTPKTPVATESKAKTPMSGGIAKRKSTNGVGALFKKRPSLKPFPGVYQALKDLADESSNTSSPKRGGHPTKAEKTPKLSPKQKPATPKQQGVSTPKAKGATPGVAKTPKSTTKNANTPKKEPASSPKKSNAVSPKQTPKQKSGGQSPGNKRKLDESTSTPKMSQKVVHVPTPYPKNVKRAKIEEKKSPKSNSDEFSKLKKKKISQKRGDLVAMRVEKMENDKAHLPPPCPPGETLLEVKKVKEALATLRKSINAAEAKSKSLLPMEDKQVLVQVNVFRPFHYVQKFMKVPLPNRVIREGADICLFTADHKEGPDFYKKKLSKEGIDYVTEIISLKTIKTEYKQFEDLRKLSLKHDFFLVEGKVCHRFLPFLGKNFVDARKSPIPVSMDKPNLKKYVDLALKKTTFAIKVQSTSFCGQIGVLGQTDKSLVENIVGLAKGLNSQMPGGWLNVSSLHLRCDSQTIPLYVQVGSPNDVTIPEKKVKQKPKPIEDEISTVPKGRVVVHPDGNVKLLKAKRADEASDDDEDSDDEDFKFDEEELDESGEISFDEEDEDLDDEEEEDDDEEEEEDDEEEVGSAEDDVSDDDEDEVPSKKKKQPTQEASSDEDEEGLVAMEKSYLKKIQPPKSAPLSKNARKKAKLNNSQKKDVRRPPVAKGKNKFGKKAA